MTVEQNMMEEPKMYLEQQERQQLYFLLSILGRELTESSFDASTYIAELQSSHFMGDPPFYEKQNQLRESMAKYSRLEKHLSEIREYLKQSMSGIPIFDERGNFIELTPLPEEKQKEDSDPFVDPNKEITDEDLPF